MNSGSKSDTKWEKIEPSQELIENALRLAERDVKAASHNLDNEDYDWAFSIAYNAMLQAGRAAMFSEGYRPAGEFKHLAVVEFAKKHFGAELSERLLFIFDKSRKKRHAAVYEQAELISEAEARSSIEFAEELLKKVREMLK